MQTPPDVSHLVLLDPSGADPGEPHAASPLLHVVATRPDAVTLAPVIDALERDGALRQLILHTGQHTDPAMSSEIFEDLGLPAPARRLETGAGSHAQQTARALEGAEAVLEQLQPAAVVVPGASNTALGVALAAAKLGLPVVRLGAGLREHDWRVPEEINRVLMDTMADTLLVPSQDAADNLLAEDIGRGRIHLTGSTVVDSVRRSERRAVERAVWQRFGVERGAYVLVTIHRPANVDDDERLARIVEALAALARRVPVVFPMHPRTKQRLVPMGDAHRLLEAGVLCGPPLRYLDFLSLQAGAGTVVTDSGTVQEEASARGSSAIARHAHHYESVLGPQRAVAVPAYPAPTPVTVERVSGRPSDRPAHSCRRRAVADGSRTSTYVPVRSR